MNCGEVGHNFPDFLWGFCDVKVKVWHQTPKRLVNKMTKWLVSAQQSKSNGVSMPPREQVWSTIWRLTMLRRIKAFWRGTDFAWTWPLNCTVKVFLIGGFKMLYTSLSFSFKLMSIFLIDVNFYFPSFLWMTSKLTTISFKWLNTTNQCLDTSALILDEEQRITTLLRSSLACARSSLGFIASSASIENTCR